MIPRFLHEIYARWTGHFWLPCPICGRHFGGHEAAEISLMSTASAGKLVCLKCNEKARHLNEKLFRDNPDVVYVVTERKVKK